MNCLTSFPTLSSATNVNVNSYSGCLGGGSLSHTRRILSVHRSYVALSLEIASAGESLILCLQSVHDLPERLRRR